MRPLDCHRHHDGDRLWSMGTSTRAHPGRHLDRDRVHFRAGLNDGPTCQACHDPSSLLRDPQTRLWRRGDRRHLEFTLVLGRHKDPGPTHMRRRGHPAKWRVTAQGDDWRPRGRDPKPQFLLIRDWWARPGSMRFDPLKHRRDVAADPTLAVREYEMRMAGPLLLVTKKEHLPDKYAQALAEL